MNYKPTLLNAIQSLDPSASATVIDNKTIVWDGTPSSFSRAQIDAEHQRLLDLWENLEYQRKRAPEYPNFIQYLDGVVKGDQEQIQAYIDACLAVKAKYPKPEGA